MNEDRTYNGWSNYETWVVNLWLENEQLLYTDIREIVLENPDLLPHQLGDLLKAYVENLDEVERVTSKPSFIADLLNAALSEVDWSEIAANVKESV